MVESNQPPLPASLFGPARCSPVELISRVIKEPRLLLFAAAPVSLLR